MTIVRADEEGLRQVGRALDASIPIVVPLPTPLPYVIAGSDAAVVNVAKGRPAEQATGVAVADFTMVTPYVELDEDTLAFARWLSAHELLNLMLPVGKGGPAWMWRPLLDERGHLYISSANRTG
ncbi:MAG: L-threonylcarbamoyladenylate synthase, partial [Pseudonocardiales bacterium]|nr:L-threonylcarbamoyladenylate synthase [Pseudonocardiales bacterium]